RDCTARLPNHPAGASPSLRLCTTIEESFLPIPGDRFMHDIQLYLDSLAAQAHPQGGWGYRPGQDAHLEPTCLALLALALRLDRWPWAEGNFSWVEPTAWACLALRQAGYGDHARVQEGIRLLLDRTFDEGGLNYGIRYILGRRTEPIPGPTALMLLALQGHGD